MTYLFTPFGPNSWPRAGLSAEVAHPSERLDMSSPTCLWVEDNRKDYTHQNML